MDKKYFTAFITTAIVAAIALAINYGLYQLPQLKGQDAMFVYPIWCVYVFFAVFSIIILSILIKVGSKDLAKVGYTFLFLTGVEMAASYLLVRPVLEKAETGSVEKINFLAVFVLFLAIEAYFTARLLNNKQ